MDWLLAGWLAGFVMPGEGYGLIGDLFLGPGWLRPTTLLVTARGSADPREWRSGSSTREADLRKRSDEDLRPSGRARLSSRAGTKPHFLIRRSSPSAHARATA
jgi:hypothetical protein